MIRTGRILNCPATCADIQRADAVWGKSIASMKGKTVKQKSAVVPPVYVPRAIPAEQVLGIDIMFFDGVMFLISYSSPMGLLMCSHLQSRGQDVLLVALTSQVVAYKQHNFAIRAVLSDPELGVKAMIPQLTLKMPGIIFAPCSADEHVPRPERKGRQIKERVRAQSASLPYCLPLLLIAWLVLFCVSRINLVPNRTHDAVQSPRELFTGRVCDAKTDLRIGFGVYVQLVDPVPAVGHNSVSKERTTGAISLLPIGNLVGSVKFLTLATLAPITRDHWTVLPMPDVIIAHLNSLAETDKRKISKDPSLRFRSGHLEIQDDDDPDILDDEPRVEDDRLPALDLDRVPQVGDDGNIVPEIGGNVLADELQAPARNPPIAVADEDVIRELVHIDVEPPVPPPGPPAPPVAGKA